jgi:hypothetical protein
MCQEKFIRENDKDILFGLFLGDDIIFAILNSMDIMRYSDHSAIMMNIKQTPM